MPVNTELATKTWARYAWCRDNGHQKFVEKADVCDRFFRGDQWSSEDLAVLRAQRRPALTINKIISTMSNVMGEQIYNRAEISFRPRGDAPAETATVLEKLYKSVSDQNLLDWKRSDMFVDGIITSRGFIDMRIEFGENMQGDIVITNLNPKNVIVDPDAELGDPETWSEVFTTKWVTADDIAVLYGKADAEILRNKENSYFPYGYDSIDFRRDRFGDMYAPMYGSNQDESSVRRDVRVIDRQYRQLDRQEHFVDPKTGEMRPVPGEWDRNRIALVTKQFGLNVTKKLVRRLRWTVIADNVVLHDEWSPYRHFTVIPYFPYFRYGHTVGLVENLIGPQELLNKTSSQELHVVNTTANSGWKIRTGSLTNMSVEELEQKGAQTGLVLEVDGDPDKDAVKIAPNQTPTGLDRISYKAEDHIKSISGITDSRMGDDREDVAAKAISLKQRASNTTLAKPLDSLIRTDHHIARCFIDLVQEFYTEERVITISHPDGGQPETFTINQMTPEGAVVNDLTLGEYDIVIGSTPVRETLEDSQFEQAMAMREAGIQVPDSVLIKASRLMDKNKIIQDMQAAQQSPEVQAQQQLAQRAQQAEVAKTEAEVAQKTADAGLRRAKAQKEQIEAEDMANTPPGAGDPAEAARAHQEMALAEEKHAHEISLAERKHQMDREKHQHDMHLKAQAQAQQAMNDRIARMNQSQQSPQPNQGA